MNSRRLFAVFLGLLSFTGVPGCGYTIGNDAAVKSISVPVFENKTLWRMNEFDLTNAVAHELQARGIYVNEEDAPWIMYGEIMDYGKPSLARGPLDEPLVGSVSLLLRIIIKNKRTGAVLKDETSPASAPIAVDRGKTEEYARASAFHALARWAASRLDQPW